jgi:AcrR family transcriptional regulator
MPRRRGTASHSGGDDRPARTRRASSGESLSIERIVAAALDLARVDGVDGLSMRKLAQRLGVDPALVYYYLRNKDDLISHVVDAAFSGFPLDWADNEDWRDSLRGWCDALYDFLHAHKGFAELLLSRPVPTPNMLEQFDAVLGCMRRGGLSETQAAQCYINLFNVVAGRVWVDTTMYRGFETPEAAGTVHGANYRALLDSMPAGKAPNVVWLGDAASTYTPRQYLSQAVEAIINYLGPQR